MKKSVLIISAILFYSCTNISQVDGLTDEVEVLRDKYGINHIYANNQHDLFFMQGYLAAKDRLFQFEIWRRQATGTVSEILGEEELDRDIGTRLFKFRGNMKDELNHYHEDGFEIVSSFIFCYLNLETSSLIFNTIEDLIPSISADLLIILSSSTSKILSA